MPTLAFLLKLPSTTAQAAQRAAIGLARLWQCAQ